MASKDLTQRISGKQITTTKNVHCTENPKADSLSRRTTRTSSENLSTKFSGGPMSQSSEASSRTPTRRTKESISNISPDNTPILLCLAHILSISYILCNGPRVPLRCNRRHDDIGGLLVWERDPFHDTAVLLRFGSTCYLCGRGW
jgi:hypothetical protein